MGGRIFVEAHDAEFLGLPVGAQHLYLVHRDTNGAEHVIRAGPQNPNFPFGGDMKIEANVPITDSADDRGGETPADRSSTELAFAPRSVDQAWAIMVKYARHLDAEGYDYRLLTKNSNAFVGAMIHAAGGNPDAMRPRGVSASDAVGYSSWDEIVADVAPPADGIFRGTSGGDTLAGMQIGEVILALAGADTVRAGRGDDRVEGGSGADRLFGQEGADVLIGGRGPDVLFGGAGPDTLAPGPGGGRLVGGPGADRFDFALGGPASGRIDDFADGTDRIRVAAAGFDALTVSAAGAHTRVAVGGTAIELRDTDASRIGPEDFLFGDSLLV